MTERRRMGSNIGRNGQIRDPHIHHIHRLDVDRQFILIEIKLLPDSTIFIERVWERR
jgi:hypothetical protein